MNGINHSHWGGVIISWSFALGWCDHILIICTGMLWSYLDHSHWDVVIISWSFTLGGVIISWSFALGCCDHILIIHTGVVWSYLDHSHWDGVIKISWFNQSLHFLSLMFSFLPILHNDNLLNQPKTNSFKFPSQTVPQIIAFLIMPLSEEIWGFWELDSTHQTPLNLSTALTSPCCIQ